MKHIVVLISGRGSNLESLLRVAEAEDWRNALGTAVVAVISNRADAAGLDIARNAGIATSVVNHCSFTTREEFDRALAMQVDVHDPALLVLAGFMRVLTPQFVRRYVGRLVNIHPSLLPAFPGLKTHERALEAGVRVHGATAHFVSDQVDAGGIISQAVVPVVPGDDAAALAARVLEQEHRLLPRAVRLVIDQRVRWHGGRVVVDGAMPGDLAVFGQ